MRLIHTDRQGNGGSDPVRCSRPGLAILLGVTALVAIHTVTVHSEKAVARELDSLGANVLILPKGVTLQDYYAADLHGETLPEELVDAAGAVEPGRRGQPLAQAVRS